MRTGFRLESVAAGLLPPITVDGPLPFIYYSGRLDRAGTLLEV